MTFGIALSTSTPATLAGGFPRLYDVVCEQHTEDESNQQATQEVCDRLVSTSVGVSTWQCLLVAHHVEQVVLIIDDFCQLVVLVLRGISLRLACR